MEFITKSLEETKKIATDFATSICREDPPDRAIRAGAHLGKNGATVVGLYGELGSGKTTFMKYLAESFGVKETIQSPTFVIMKKYELRVTSNEVRKNYSQSYLVSRTSYFDFLYHFDAYRIEKDEEMLNLGWQEIITDPKNLICIEWPERIRGLMPPHIMLRFEHGERENERKISIT